MANHNTPPQLLDLRAIEELIPQASKVITLKRFGQYVGDHLLRRHVADGDLTSIHAIFDEEEADIDMAGTLRIRTPILDQCHGALVVLVDDGRFHVVALETEEVASPDHL